MGQVETWNGSSWTETTDLNTHRSDPTGNGTLTSGLAYGGQADPAATVNTESWNGSAWTEVADASAGAGKVADSDSSSSSAFFAGGDGPPGGAVNSTEEWTFSHSVKTVTTS